MKEGTLGGSQGSPLYQLPWNNFYIFKTEITGYLLTKEYRWIPFLFHTQKLTQNVPGT